MSLRHEDWKECFSQLAPGLVLFARQWVALARGRRRHRAGRFRSLLAPPAFDPESRAPFCRLCARSVSICSGAMRGARDAKRPLCSRASRQPSRILQRGRIAARPGRCRGPFAKEQREVVVMKIWNELTFPGNRDRARHFAKHGGIALSLCPNEFEKESVAAMNDFSEIESELKKLRPAPVASESDRADREGVAGRIIASDAAAVTQKHSTRANWISLGVGLGLAAAAVFLMLARVHNEQPAKNQPTVAATKSSPNERRCDDSDQSRTHDSRRPDRSCLPHAG